MSTKETITLHNGVKMPLLGLGTYKLEEGNDCVQAVTWALEIGYRLIDTAKLYGNEKSVGKAIRESGIPRGDIFLTTKLWNDDQGYDETLRAFDASLSRLGLDYVDLYLVHWPIPEKYKETWRAMERLYSEGRAKTVGVSNYLVEHMEMQVEISEVLPMVNQVEFHPRLQLPDLQQYCANHRVALQAWTPIMKGKVGDIPEMRELAEKYDVSPVQLTIRWEMQKGISTVPKSGNRERLQSNARVDFKISPEDMKKIDKLDQNLRLGVDPTTVTF